MSKKQIKEDLQGARELIVEHGWRQGDLGTITEGFCILGALDYHLVVVEHDANVARGERVLQYLESFTGGDVVSWNDLEGRTKEDVLALFDRAIASL